MAADDRRRKESPLPYYCLFTTILGGKSEYFLITDYSTHYFDRLMSMIICYQKVLALTAKNYRK